VADHFSGNKPYLELTLSDGSIHRHFSELSEDDELVWHRDMKCRKIKVLQSNGWHFQFDNEMPFELTNSLEFNVPALVYHRVLRGTGPLELIIQE
jgi:hypothetical protein